MNAIAKFLGRLLEWVVIVLMVALTTLVVVAVIYRKAGASLSWYDEVAAIGLAWITYYGAALAALRRKHIGFDGVLLALPVRWRLGGVVVAEVFVIGFFVLMTWAGMRVLEVLQGDTLVSLRWVPITLTQSVIPIGGALFIVCELLSMPAYWRDVREGISAEHPPTPPPDDPLAESPLGAAPPGAAPHRSGERPRQVEERSETTEKRSRSARERGGAVKPRRADAPKPGEPAKRPGKPGRSGKQPRAGRRGAARTGPGGRKGTSGRKGPGGGPRSGGEA